MGRKKELLERKTGEKRQSELIPTDQSLQFLKQEFGKLKIVKRAFQAKWLANYVANYII